MTDEPQEEHFSIGLTLLDNKVIVFEITARSSRLKRWAFFGLLTLVTLLVVLAELSTKLEVLFT